jgi:hypothetical protein
LPIGKSSQFEAGYKGNFNDLNKDFSFPGTTIGTIDPNTGVQEKKLMQFIRNTALKLVRYRTICFKMGRYKHRYQFTCE